MPTKAAKKQTAPEKADPPAKDAAKKAAGVPTYANPDVDSLVDRVAVQLDREADDVTTVDDPFGGEPLLGVNHPAHIARQAVDLYGKHRYNPAFRLILVAAYKDGHKYGRGDG